MSTKELDQLRDLHDQVQRLTEKVAQLEHTLSLASSVPSTQPSVPQGGTENALPLSSAVTTTTNRRSLLKWSGLGAAAALAAAGVVGPSHAPSAHAADGDALICGADNFASSQTYLKSTANFGVRFEALTTGATVLALTSGGGGYGISSSAGADGVGVYGVSDGTRGFGVIGFSDSGYGVAGSTNTGIDIWAGGTGRFLQTSASFTGAPTTGSYLQGEQIRDNTGDLYICVTSGSPGTWRRVAAGTPGHSGSFNFLPEPIRLLDTRIGSPWNAGSSHTLQVTGVVVDGISVPVGAIGVIGAVTVVGPTSGGDLRLFPGPALPPTSSINFATGQTLANSVTVRFNGSGQIQFKVDMASGTTTNVLFDAVGYVL